MMLLIFPFVSQFWYYQVSHEKINEFRQATQTLTSQEVQSRIELAQAYNSSLLTAGVSVSDPYNEEQQKAGRAEYARMLEVNEQIGVVTIPKISQKLPIYTGTSEEVLQKGVGHLEGSSLPVGGENTHTILSAHRGLPHAQLFTDLDQLVVGDLFYIQNLKETLAYQVERIVVIEPTDIRELSLVLGEDRVTLLTCTPYMVNSHRLLVQAKRIPYSAEVEQQLEETAQRAYSYYLGIVTLSTVVLGTLFYILLRRKKNGS